MKTITSRLSPAFGTIAGFSGLAFLVLGAKYIGSGNIPLWQTWTAFFACGISTAICVLLDDS